MMPTTVEALPDLLLGNVFSFLNNDTFAPEITTVCKRWRLVAKTCAHLSVYEHLFYGYLYGQGYGDGYGYGYDYGFQPCGMRSLSWFIYSFKYLRSLYLIPEHKIRRRVGKGFPDLHLRGMIHHVRKTIRNLGLAYEAYFFRIWIDLSECLHLESLQIQKAWIDAFPEDISSLSRLGSCSLMCVVITNSALTQLVNLCPKLKHLQVEDCLKLRDLLMSNQSLETVMVSRCEIRSVNLQCPNLKSLKMLKITCGEGNNLLELQLGENCRLDFPAHGFRKLEMLEMEGMWHAKSLQEVFALAREGLSVVSRRPADGSINMLKKKSLLGNSVVELEMLGARIPFSALSDLYVYLGRSTRT